MEPHHITSITSHGVRDRRGDAGGGLLSSKRPLAYHHNRYHEPQISLGQQGLTARRKGSEDIGTGALNPVKRWAKRTHWITPQSNPEKLKNPETLNGVVVSYKIMHAVDNKSFHVFGHALHTHAVYTDS